ncbi:MAG: hypothetical protein IPP26_10285 [Flavobacteriales bacterium]|nr:hypothetical protein [Flavobacteriales bacterium]
MLTADSVGGFLQRSPPGGRTVYGGGGIMPGRFRAGRYRRGSGYLTELFFRGAINQFAFDPPTVNGND